MEFLKDCSICLEQIGEKNRCITECGHEFCLKCLATSLTKNIACPCCRTSIIDKKEEKNVHGDDDDNEWDDDDDEDIEDYEEHLKVPLEELVEELNNEGISFTDMVLLYSYNTEDEIYTKEYMESIEWTYENTLMDLEKRYRERLLFDMEDTRRTIN
jgi:hypothetical protein